MVGAFAAWLLASGIALAAISDYASTPGAAARAPASWPAESRIARTPGRGTIVMVAHIRCACTRASLHELERVMARAGERAEAFVVFVGPPGIELLDLRSIARSIPHVTLIEDEREARRFGAVTSGQVVAYDAAGELVFRGGITPARGHEGDSAGNEMVRRFVTTGHARSAAASRTSASDVFGCALFDNHVTPAGADTSDEKKEP